MDGRGKQFSLDLSPGRGPDGPVVLGIGKTGQRIASAIASRSKCALRQMVFFPGSAPVGPSSVPVSTWPTDRAGAVRAAEELRGRVAGARSAVIACSLSTRGAETLAPALALAVRPAIKRLAAVGVAPFSFEGPSRTETTAIAVRELCALVDLMAVASREHVRTMVPPETPLEEACAKVDEVAATAAETLAWVLARGFGSGIEPGIGPDRAAIALQAGAGEGGSIAEATRAAAAHSLLGATHLGAARGVLLAIAVSRTPSLGELNETERVLAELLPHGTPITVDFAVDSSLGGRALAAVCLAPGASPEEKDLFPSQDAGTLRIPAFLRRRAAGLTRGGVGSTGASWKVA